MELPFHRIERLPPYVFRAVDQLKTEARARGEDIIDMGMGNPDRPTPSHIVDKAVDALRRGDTHRYSRSQGIPRLRQAVCRRYERRFGVSLDPDRETVVTIGSKEGLAHLALAISGPGDSVLAPSPSYPIHTYGFVIAGADVITVPLITPNGFLSGLEQTVQRAWPRPKGLVVNFPANPTTHCIDLAFLSRLVSFARAHGMWLIHDLAYADIVFDGYRAPSILQVPGARECAVEVYSLSKSYNMPGWRIGFCCGNEHLVNALVRIKSYLDYGVFTPLQVASIQALEGPEDCVDTIREMYRRRRDALCEGLVAAGWDVEKPRATMFVWAPIPERFRELGSLTFSKMLLQQAGVAVSPGIGFGPDGDPYVRFALVENEQRIRQAVRGIRRMLVQVA